MTDERNLDDAWSEPDAISPGDSPRTGEFLERLDAADDRLAQITPRGFKQRWEHKRLGVSIGMVRRGLSSDMDVAPLMVKMPPIVMGVLQAHELVRRMAEALVDRGVDGARELPDDRTVKRLSKSLGRQDREITHTDLDALRAQLPTLRAIFDGNVAAVTAAQDAEVQRYVESAAPRCEKWLTGGERSASGPEESHAADQRGRDRAEAVADGLVDGIELGVAGLELAVAR